MYHQRIELPTQGACLETYFLDYSERLRNSVSRADAIALVRDAFAFTAAFEGEIPGAKKIECGNYLEHDLPGAKAEAAAYTAVLDGWTEDRLAYPD